MKVAVTGGLGFIGSHIADALSVSGHSLVLVDNLSTGRIENLRKGASFYCCDVLSEEIEGIFDTERPEVLYHEAAQIKVQKSVEAPVFDAENNIKASVRLFELCVKYGVRKVIYASTAAVYGNPMYIPVDNEHPLKPISFYGLSKLVPEHYLEIFKSIYGLDYTVLRYSNVYGPRQVSDGEGGVVSIFAGELLSGRPPVIFGDGSQTRDFIYVKDVASANLSVLEKGGGKTFNVSTGNAVTIKGLADKMKYLCGFSGETIYKPAREADISHSVLDNAPIRAETGWTPSYSLELGLEETIRYFGKQLM